MKWQVDLMKVDFMKWQVDFMKWQVDFMASLS